MYAAASTNRWPPAQRNRLPEARSHARPVDPAIRRRHTSLRPFSWSDTGRLPVTALRGGLCRFLPATDRLASRGAGLTVPLSSLDRSRLGRYSRSHRKMETPMKLSRAASYALDAVARLSHTFGGLPVPCSKLAADGKMPGRFLLQVLRRLATHRIRARDEAGEADSHWHGRQKITTLGGRRGGGWTAQVGTSQASGLILLSGRTA